MVKLGNTRILGHRGARNEALENTLSAFQHAHGLHARGLAGVEFDVQLTADNHLIVFHDETLQRLCGVQSRVDQLSLAEIERHLQSGHQIITLDKLAQKLSDSSQSWLPEHEVSSQGFVAPNYFLFKNLCFDSPLSKFTHIELEIKTHSRTPHSKLIQALIDYFVDTPLASLPIVLTTFDVQLLNQLRHNKFLATIPRGLLVRLPELLATASNTALQLGCVQLGIYHPLITQAIIQEAHRYNLLVSAWTVNDIEIAKQLAQWQVDVIITDIPTQML
ncbi:glycerophosphodiester phosphodiesterase [uncultured Psychrobacter sp.]|uniref:glycerophosphodiester phosphodiesterase n=1 Tax=uncultured Psychrobacter sp. TaxID=259303 RepID=UPI0034578C02